MLPQSEIDAITKEAEKFAMQFLPPEEKWEERHEIKFNEITNCYEAGATEERQRAKVLADAAKNLIDNYYSSTSIRQMTDAITELEETLDTYNKNKPNDPSK